MDIYQSILKQSSIIQFIVNNEGIVIDTNAFTMKFLDIYDICGRDFFSLLDDLSRLKIKTCYSNGQTDSVEVNFVNLYGECKSAYVVCSKMESYMSVFGILCKGDSNTTVLNHLERISINAGFTVKHEDYTEQEEQDKRIWQMSNIDGLTGLYNMKFFDDIYEKWYADVLEVNRGSGIILIDIDNFKELNDKYGYEKGDRTLFALSQIILSCIRSTDYAIRYDGDMFLILLNDIKENSIYSIINRISQTAKKELSITVSTGYVRIDTSSSNNKDELMCEVKRSLTLSRDKVKNMAAEE